MIRILDAVLNRLQFAPREEVALLLDELNERGYRYKVLYRGDESEEMGQVIGLKLTERFFLRMKRVLGEDDVRLLRELVRSSADLTYHLEGFARESGRQMSAGEVYTRLIALAASSRSRTGPGFRFKVLRDEERGGTRLHLSIGIQLQGVFQLGCMGDSLTSIAQIHLHCR